MDSKKSTARLTGNDLQPSGCLVPQTYCGQPVTIRITLDEGLRIYSNDLLVASHQLTTATSGWQTVAEHHQPLWQQVCGVEHRPLSVYEELL